MINPHPGNHSIANVPPLSAQSQYKCVLPVFPTVVTGEHEDRGVFVVGAVMLEAVHTEAVLVAGVEGGPCATYGVVNLRQESRMRR